MTALVIVIVIVAALGALWLVNSSTDLLFRKGMNRLYDRQRVSETERIRQRLQQQRQDQDHPPES